MKLKDQVAIVTGAGRNIGEEIAKLFAAEGAKIAIVDMDKSRGERVAGAIKAKGGDAALFQADVSKAATSRSWSRTSSRVSGASTFWSTMSPSRTTSTSSTSRKRNGIASCR